MGGGRTERGDVMSSTPRLDQMGGQSRAQSLQRGSHLPPHPTSGHRAASASREPVCGTAWGAYDIWVDGNACVVRWSVVERVVISCTSAGKLKDADLDAILADMHKANVNCSLGLALGTAHMTGVQRRRVVDFMRDRSLRAVVLTHSALVRGVMTALSWFNDRISSGGLDDLEQALDRLGLHGEQRETVRRTALGLREEVSWAEREHARSA